MKAPYILRGAVYCCALLLATNVTGFSALSSKLCSLGFEQRNSSIDLKQKSPPADSHTWYLDSDGDGFGDASSSVEDTIAPENYVADNTDCNDQDNAIFPGATEVCDNLDDNCNGEIDEGVQSSFYADGDEDGFGNAANSIAACEAPQGYVADQSDCDDAEASVNPDASEVCNGVDDNCNGVTDEGVQSTFYADNDGDGFGNAGSSIAACDAPQGYAANQSDCDDANPSINPNASEICNGVDDNCDGETDEGVQSAFYADSDEDGFGNAGSSIAACEAPQGYVANQNDCNDANPSINPNVSEICNGVDDNCNGVTDEGVQSTFYADSDGDSFGNLSNSVNACTAPAGYVTDHSDCNDNNSLVNPNAVETCNGLDDDCSGQIDDNLSASGISIIWQKTFGGTKADLAQGMDYTHDGGFVIVGKSLSNNGDLTLNHGKNDFWIVKIDGNGTLVWQKAYGGPGDDVANAVRATADGGYIVAGSTAANGGNVTGWHGTSDYWLIKLDNNGNLQWQKCFGGSSQDVAYDVDQASDGGYVVAGYTRSGDGNVTGSHASGDYWVLKTDSNGNLQWQKAYGGSAYDFAHAVCHASDGGYLVSGYARSNDGDVALAYGQEDFWILKLDQNGNLSWQKTYGGTGGEGASSAQQTSDGGYVLAGITHSFNIDVVGNHGNEHDFWVVKIDANGNKQWTKCLGGNGSEDGHMIRQTSDGGYLVCGKGDSHDGDATVNYGGHDYWVVKLNGSGSIQWQKSLGGSLDDEAYGALETTDGNFITAGYAYSNDFDVSGNHGSSDFWIAKCSAPSLHIFFADADGDSYGNAAVSIQACSAPPGYVSSSSDCNDANANVHPGAFENCNGIDDDCDSQIDEDFLVATISPLATITICKTSTLTLQCNSDPAFTYQWFRNGLPISGATNSTFATSVTGSYSVVITKGLCSANSPVTIVKNTTGIVKVTPQGTLTTCPKASIHFSVPESPGMIFQWHNSAGIIPGATTPNYSTSVAGSYFVNESDITGCSFNSSTSTLKNYAAPTATVTVTGKLNICTTGSVTFNASVITGQTYQWYKDSAPITGATSTTYIATVAGAYKVLATTTNGCTAFSSNKNVTGCKMEDQKENDEPKAKLNIYPNPSDGTFTFQFQLPDQRSGKANVYVINTLGQILINNEVTISDGYIQQNFSLPEHAKSGMYYFKLYFEGLEYISPLMLQK